MQTKVPRNAQPSRLRGAAARPGTQATAATANNTASPASRAHLGPDEERHGDDRGDEPDLQRRARLARCRMSPSVFSETNIAPWVRNSPAW